MASVGQIPPRIPAQVYGAQGPQKVPVSEPIPPKGGSVGMTPEEELRNLAMFQLGLALMDDRPVGEPFFSTNVSPILKGLGDQLMESRRLNISEEQGEKQIGVQERGVGIQEKAEDRLRKQGERKLELAEEEVQLQREALLQKGALSKARNELEREKLEVLQRQNNAELLLKERALRQELGVTQGEQRLKAQANFLAWKKLQNDITNQGRLADAQALESAAKVLISQCGDGKTDPLGLEPAGGGGCTPEQRIAIYDEALRQIRPDLWEAGQGEADLSGDLDRVIQGLQAGRGTTQQAIDAIRRAHGESGVRQLQRRLQEMETNKTETLSQSSERQLSKPVEELPIADTREEADAMVENAEHWLRNGIDIKDWYKRNRQLMSPENRKKVQKLLQKYTGK